MAKINVSEFVIEVGFQEKVTAGLAKLESKVNQISHKLETSLNTPFAKDRSRGLIETLNKVEKASANTSRKINENLSKAFQVRFERAGMFNPMIHQAETAAREIHNRLQNATRGINFGGGSAGGSGGGSGRPPRRGQPRPGSMSEAQRLNQRFTNSAAFRRLEMSGGSNTIFARQMQARAAAITARNAGNSENLRREFARLTQQLREHEQAVRRDTRTTNDHERAERRDQRAANRHASSERRSERGGSIAGGTMKGMLAANAVTFVAQKAVEVAEEAYKQGAERSQAKTQMGAAFGADSAKMQEGIAGLANKYGQNQTDLMREISVQRNTMPKEAFSNEQLLKNFETMSVFSHATGVNNESVGRANYAIGQIAGSAKINKQDINQLTNAIPEALSVTAKAMGKSKQWLIQNMKDLKPEVLLENFYKGMENFNKETGAAVTAQKSIQAQQGRMTNAWNNDLIAMFDATGTSVGGWMDVITNALIAAQPIFVAVGENVKSLSDTIHTVGDAFGKIGQALDDLWKSMSPESQAALKTVADYFGGLFGWMVQAPLDVFKDAVDALINLINRISGSSEDNPNKSERWGNNVEKGSWVEKGLDMMSSVNARHAREEGAATPAFDALKNPQVDESNPFGLPAFKTMPDTSKLGSNPTLPPQQFQLKQDPLEIKPLTLTMQIPGLDNVMTKQDFKLDFKAGLDGFTVNASPLTGWNKGNRPNVANFPQQAPAGAK